MSITKPLTTAQHHVLAAAAERADGLLLPLPATVAARGTARQSLLASLLKLGRAEEQLTDTAELCWRTDEHGQRYTLRLARNTVVGSNTDANGTAQISSQASKEGRAPTAASQSETAQSPEPDTAGQPGVNEARNGTAQPGGKLGQVLAAVTNPAGATMAELTALTGWLPHTTRAALTRLRQRGHVLHLAEQDGRKAYRAGAGC